MRPKENKPLNEKIISKIIRSSFKNNKIKDSFHGVKMYNDIQVLAKESKINLDLNLNGISVAVPVINKFIDFKKEIDLDKINQVIKSASIRSLSVTNNIHQEDQIDRNGINALDIEYIALNDSLDWGISFSEFLKTKELKVTFWNNPIEQLILCILLSEIFECYFDLDHHFKAASTILFMDDLQLKRFCIKRSKYSDKHHTFLKNRLNSTKQRQYLSDAIFCGNYKPVKSSMGYPYINAFAKQLPHGLENYLEKCISVFSPQTKKDFLVKFKKAGFHLKLLMLVFDKKDIPQNSLKGFKAIYKAFANKESLINRELNINYDDFIKAMENYVAVTKGIKISNHEIRKLHTEGLVKELINFKKGTRNNLINAALGFIPVNNYLLNDIYKFKDYEVKQIHSKQELIELGHEFGNCLRNYQNYHKALKQKNTYFFVFRSKTKLNNMHSFIAHFGIQDREFKALEVLRKNNDSCSSEERFVMVECLYSLDLINIPGEFYHHYLMKILNTIMSKGIENGINETIENAPKIFATLKKLKKLNRWVYDADTQLITDDISNLIVDSLSNEIGIQHISRTENSNIA